MSWKMPKVHLNLKKNHYGQQDWNIRGATYHHKKFCIVLTRVKIIIGTIFNQTMCFCFVSIFDWGTFTRTHFEKWPSFTPTSGQWTCVLQYANKRPLGDDVYVFWLALKDHHPATIRLPWMQNLIVAVLSIRRLACWLIHDGFGRQSRDYPAEYDTVDLEGRKCDLGPASTAIVSRKFNPTISIYSLGQHAIVPTHSPRVLPGRVIRWHRAPRVLLPLRLL